jgi:hypothetical protein
MTLAVGGPDLAIWNARAPRIELAKTTRVRTTRARGVLNWSVATCIPLCRIPGIIRDYPQLASLDLSSQSTLRDTRDLGRETTRLVSFGLAPRLFAVDFLWTQ